MKKQFVKQAKLPSAAYDKPLKEVLSVYQAKSSYALIDFGDGRRCAWCKELVSEIGKDNLDKHLNQHVPKGGEQNGKEKSDSKTNS